jgi:hypothetical protein
MVALRHAIKINASRERIFRALTDLGEMAAWRVGSVAGSITPGGVLRLEPKAGLAFGWVRRPCNRTPRWFRRA